MWRRLLHAYSPAMLNRKARNAATAPSSAVDFGDLGTDAHALQRQQQQQRQSFVMFVMSVLVIIVGLGGLAWSLRHRFPAPALEQPMGVPSSYKQLMLTMMAAIEKAEREVRADDRRDPLARGEAVTAADLASHQILTALLGRPNHPVISEEGVASGNIPLLTPDNADLVFYVDPLDATREYTERLDQYVSLSACLAVCGEPIAAVTTFPFTRDTFIAMPSGELLAFHDKQLTNVLARLKSAPIASFQSPVGAAACRRGTCATQREARRGSSPTPRARLPRLHGNTPHTMESLRLVLTRSTLEPHIRPDGRLSLDATVTELTRRFPQLNVTRAGGAGYKSAAVARGAADAYIHEGSLRLWDTCASEAIIRAAGGEMTGWLGERIDYCVPPAWFDAEPEARVALGKAAFGGSGVVAAADVRVHAELLRTIQG